MKSSILLTMTALLLPMCGGAQAVDTDWAETCKILAPQIRPGMTRAEIEKSLTHDGGLSGIFRDERYVVRGSTCSAEGEVMKINLDFKPAGMSDAAYFEGKWTTFKQSPQDTVMRVYPKYIEAPYAD